MKRFTLSNSRFFMVLGILGMLLGVTALMMIFVANPAL